MKDKLKEIAQWTEAAVVYTLIYYAICFIVLGIWYLFTSTTFREHPIASIKAICKKTSDKSKEMFYRASQKLENAYIQSK